jgi:hypothetical protein
MICGAVVISSAHQREGSNRLPHRLWYGALTLFVWLGMVGSKCSLYTALLAWPFLLLNTCSVDIDSGDSCLHGLLLAWPVVDSTCSSGVGGSNSLLHRRPRARRL